MLTAHSAPSFRIRRSVVDRTMAANPFKRGPPPSPPATPVRPADTDSAASPPALNFTPQATIMLDNLDAKKLQKAGRLARARLAEIERLEIELEEKWGEHKKIADEKKEVEHKAKLM